MNPRKTTIAILTTLSVSLALADDFKTINGKEYKNAIVTQVDPDGIIVKTKTGISKLYFPELPEDVRKRYHYDSEKAAATQAAAVQQTQEINRQAAELDKHQKDAYKEPPEPKVVGSTPAGRMLSAISERVVSDKKHCGPSVTCYCSLVIGIFAPAKIP